MNSLSTIRLAEPILHMQPEPRLRPIGRSTSAVATPMLHGRPPIKHWMKITTHAGFFSGETAFLSTKLFSAPNIFPFVLQDSVSGMSQDVC